MNKGTTARDIGLAIAALAVLALLPHLFPSKALSDFVIRLSAFALFASGFLMACDSSKMM